MKKEKYEVQDELVVTVRLNRAEQEALYERMRYLANKSRSGRVTKATAIREAILATGYQRPKKAAEEKNS